MRHRMRPAAVVSEAARNIATGTTGALVLALLLGVICAGLAVIDAQAINDLRDEARLFASSGASVRTLDAKKQVDAKTCDGLPGSGSVRSAGALREAAPVVLLAAPANSIPSYDVTPGLAGVLRVRRVSSTGVWISQDLADTLKAVAGQRLGTRSGVLTIAGTFAWPEDGRDTRLGYAVLQPVAATGRAMDECWADVWPSSDAADTVIRAATFVRPAAADPVTIGQLNQARGTGLDTQAEFRSRPTRFALHGCLAAGFVLGFVAIRRRRLEYSGARHSGQQRWAQTATALLETAVWALAGLLVAGTLLSLALYLANGATAPEIFALDVRGPAVGALGSGFGALAALALVREDHLFRYFKDR